MPPAAIAMGLVAAAAAPYLAVSLAFGSFRWEALAWIAGLAAAASFWYVVLPHHPGSDVLFLVLMAVVWLSKIIPPLYVSPHPKMQLQALGTVDVVPDGHFCDGRDPPAAGSRLRILAAKAGMEDRRDLLCCVFACRDRARLVDRIRDARLPHADLGRTTFFAIATFFGVLWVLALGEEFLFRGLLQQWMVGWLKSVWAGILVTSMLFGAMHLWFHRFPNWRIAAMATLLGVCLRPRVPANPQYSRPHGDPCPGGHDLADLLFLNNVARTSVRWTGFSRSLPNPAC